MLNIKNFISDVKTALTLRFVAALAGNVSVELPVGSAAQGLDLFQAAAMEEATSEEQSNFQAAAQKLSLNYAGSNY